MGQQKNKIIFISISIGFFFVYSVIAKEKFESPISKKEKRIIDFKKAITQTEGFPETMRLFFKCKKDDYVVFYDWNGHEAYYRYRRNKFDLEAEEFVVGLIEGAAYEVNGKFSGMLVHVKKGEEKISPIPEFVSDSLIVEEKKHKENIPVFILKSYKTLEIDELIY